MKHEPGLYLAPKIKFLGKGEQFKLFVETKHHFHILSSDAVVGVCQWVYIGPNILK